MRIVKSVIITTLFLALCLYCVIVSTYRIQIPTGSMEPTLSTGCTTLALKDTLVPAYNRGDIVLFLSEEEEKLLVKRLIGIPGDIIMIDSGAIYVNGVLLEEPYVIYPDIKSGVFFVPENEYFFLGDNRMVSYDARYWETPFIAQENIKGKIICQIKPAWRWYS